MTTSTDDPTSADDSGHHIQIRLSELRQQRGITWAELADRVGITEANLYALARGGKAGIRFRALSSLCEVLECTPGDLLIYAPPGDSPATPSSKAGARA